MGGMPLALSCLLILLLAAAQNQVSDLPPQLQEQFVRGIEAQKSGDLDMAERLFKGVLEQGGKSPLVYNAVGNMHQMKGEHKQALAVFGISERLDPKDPVHHSLAGVSLLALGRPTEATREFRLAVQMQPDSLLFREQLAGVYMSVENYPAAIEQYTKLLETKADSPEYLYRLGRAYLGYSGSCFEKIKRINPGSARLFQEMGDQYLVQGKLDKAVESYQQAMAADPSIPEVHFLLGQCYLRQGEKEKALKAVDKALELTPGSPAALRLRRSILDRSANP